MVPETYRITIDGTLPIRGDLLARGRRRQGVTRPIGVVLRLGTTYDRHVAALTLNGNRWNNGWPLRARRTVDRRRRWTGVSDDSTGSTWVECVVRRNRLMRATTDINATSLVTTPCLVNVARMTEPVLGCDYGSGWCEDR